MDAQLVQREQVGRYVRQRTRRCTPKRRPENFQAPWTPQDDEILRLGWQDIGLKRLSSRLRRTPVAVFGRAKMLGLPMGTPPGHETIGQACDRLGVTETMFFKAVALAEAVWKRSPYDDPIIRHKNTDPGWRRTSDKRKRIVESSEADDVLALYLSTEYILVAAKGTGFTPQTIRRELAERGQLYRYGARQWRALTVDIQAVVAHLRVSKRRSQARRGGDVPVCP